MLHPLLDVQSKGPDQSYPKATHKENMHCVDISSSQATGCYANPHVAPS